LESGAEAEAAAQHEVVPIKPPMSLSAAAAQIYKLTSLSSDAFFVTALSEGFMTNMYVSPSVTKQIGYTPEELFSRCVRCLSVGTTLLRLAAPGKSRWRLACTRTT